MGFTTTISPSAHNHNTRPPSPPYLTVAGNRKLAYEITKKPLGFKKEESYREEDVVRARAIEFEEMEKMCGDVRDGWKLEWSDEKPGVVHAVRSLWFGEDGRVFETKRIRNGGVLIVHAETLDLLP